MLYHLKFRVLYWVQMRIKLLKHSPCSQGTVLTTEIIPVGTNDLMTKTLYCLSSRAFKFLSTKQGKIDNNELINNYI